MTDAPASINEELFRRHFNAMVGLAGPPGVQNAENIAQEAFVRLYVKRRHLRNPAAARAYLRRTVVNLTRSGHRHLGVVRRHPPDQPALALGVEDTVLASAGKVAVMNALRLLPRGAPSRAEC